MLNNGKRYPRRTLQRSNGTWSASTFLVAPGDEQVLAAAAANKCMRLAGAVDTAYDVFRRSRSLEDADALDEALRAWRRAHHDVDTASDGPPLEQGRGIDTPADEQHRPRRQ